MKKEEERMQRDIIIMQANNSLRHDMRRDTFFDMHTPEINSHSLYYKNT